MKTELKAELESDFTLPANINKSIKELICSTLSATATAEVSFDYKVKAGVITKSDYKTSGKPTPEMSKLGATLNEEVKKFLGNGGGNQDGELTLDLKIEI